MVIEIEKIYIERSQPPQAEVEEPGSQGGGLLKGSNKTRRGIHARGIIEKRKKMLTRNDINIDKIALEAYLLPDHARPLGSYRGRSDAPLASAWLSWLRSASLGTRVSSPSSLGDTCEGADGADGCCAAAVTSDGACASAVRESSSSTGGADASASSCRLRISCLSSVGLVMGT
jgi:hypothetical protein